MSPLKLNGSTSGFVALDAPAAAGSNTLVLPTGNGSANQLLKNGSTAGTLAWSSMVETTTGVGIGTSSPSYALDVKSGTGQFAFSNTGSNPRLGFLASNVAENAEIHGYALKFHTGGSAAFDGTERMRITSGGFLKARGDETTYYGAAASYHELRAGTGGSETVWITHTAGSPKGVFIKYTNAAPNSTGSEFLYCEDNTAQRAVIRSNGGLANYSGNNVNLSDINSKKDISPAAGTWDCIKEWEIVNYRYKDQPDDAVLNLGVIAQQVAENCPEVITVFEEAKNDQPEKLGIKEQQMMWMAIKALQEAQARIETLEANNAALEARLSALEVTP